MSRLGVTVAFTLSPTHHVTLSLFPGGSTTYVATGHLDSARRMVTTLSARRPTREEVALFLAVLVTSFTKSPKCAIIRCRGTGYVARRVASVPLRPNGDAQCRRHAGRGVFVRPPAEHAGEGN